MPRGAIAPTKSNLLAAAASLAFAREGHELLTKKRDILVAELLDLAAEAAHTQRRLDEKLGEAFAALDRAVLDSGRRAVREAAWAVDARVETRVSERRVMGVGLPVVHSTARGEPPFYPARQTGFRLDEAQRLFAEAVKLLDAFTGMFNSVLRLAAEVKKSMRRVNALEKIYIPDYTDVLQYIANTLEESERESFFVLKMIKARLSGARSGARGGG